MITISKMRRTLGNKKLNKLFVYYSLAGRKPRPRDIVEVPTPLGTAKVKI